MQVALLQQPVQVSVGAVLVAQAVQNVDGEAGVPEPRVAVVPVAGATNGLRQAGGWSGHDGAGVAVHHQVQREERTHNRITPQARVVHPRDETLPVTRRRRHFLIGAVAFDAGRPPVAIGEHEPGRLPLAKGEARMNAAVVERQGHRSCQRHSLAAAARPDRCRAGARSLRREGRHGAGVVVAGLVVAEDLHFARLAAHDAVNLVVGPWWSLRVVVVVVLGRHEVRQVQHAAGGGERGTQYVGVGYVGLVGGGHRGRGSNAKVPSHVGVQYGGENARRVKAWEAAPVDRAVGPDQCRRRHIAYQSVAIHITCPMGCGARSGEASIAPGAEPPQPQGAPLFGQSHFRRTRADF